MNVYRFRSMKYLLGDEYQEFERETIYFASPDQLNDPMEGFRDIVWRGDKIVWTNFVKHFVYCLHEGYFLLRTTGNSRELGVDDIPFLGSWDQTSASQGQGIFEEIWHRFHNLPKMPEIIMALAKSNRKIRYRELEFYLRSIHHALLAEIEEIYTAHGVVSEPGRVRTLEGWSVHAMLEDLLESIIMFKKSMLKKAILRKKFTLHYWNLKREKIIVKLICKEAGVKRLFSETTIQFVKKYLGKTAN